MLAVHPSGFPEENGVVGGIQNLAREPQLRNIPSILLDRYANTLNRNFFSLEVNDHLSGGGYHSMYLTAAEPKIIIAGAFLDGCISNALSHFSAQMERLGQEKMTIYIIQELTIPFCEIGYELDERVQGQVENLVDCMRDQLIRDYGVQNFLTRMIRTFDLDVQRLRDNYVSETLIPEGRRPGPENDIGYVYHYNGTRVEVMNSDRLIEVHFINKEELLEKL